MNFSFFSKRQWLILSGAAAAVVVVFLFLSGWIPGLAKKTAEPVSLKFLGVDDGRIWQPIIQQYQKQFPNVRINYQQVDGADYEQTLLNRLAADGPDIFMFHGSWLPKHFDKIAPASAGQFSAHRFESLFPTVAVQDFAPDGVVFALPLYIDTLVLYYNKDLFDENGIALPPETWSQFQSAVKNLRRLDREGGLTGPAAGIGGSAASVSRAADLLNLLFLQTGVPMTDKFFSQADFSRQGRGAFNFYLSFSDPANDFYAWNDQLPLDIELFAEGKLPILFHYRTANGWIRQNNPFLNFAAAPVPRPSGAGTRVAYANYFGLAVSNKTKHGQAAWDFITFAAANPEISEMYLTAADQSPALRTMIREIINAQPANPFAGQALVARSWPRIDNQAIEKIFDQMIKSALSGQLTAADALSRAESEVSRLMRKR